MNADITKHSADLSDVVCSFHKLTRPDQLSPLPHTYWVLAIGDKIAAINGPFDWLFKAAQLAENLVEMGFVVEIVER